MSKLQDDIAAPPQAPKVAPRFRMYRSEMIGIGAKVSQIDAQSDSLSVSIQYPELMRFQNFERLRVTLTNIGERLASNVVVRLDGAYIDAFAEVSTSPEPVEPYAFQIPQLAVGESATVVVQLTAHAYGYHDGRLTFEQEGDRSEASFTTLVFP